MLLLQCADQGDQLGQLPVRRAARCEQSWVPLPISPPVDPSRLPCYNDSIWCCTAAAPHCPMHALWRACLLSQQQLRSRTPVTSEGCAPHDQAHTERLLLCPHPPTPHPLQVCHCDVVLLNSGTLRSDAVHPAGKLTNKDLVSCRGWDRVGRLVLLGRVYCAPSSHLLHLPEQLPSANYAWPLAFPSCLSDLHPAHAG